MTRLSIVMPVYNDEVHIKKNIEYAISELERIGYNFELIVVDDCSTDNTWREADSIKDRRAYLYMEPENQGKGKAFIDGYKHALGDYIVLMDSDLQIPIRELPTFFNLMRIYKADAVIGNKRHPYSNVKYTLARWIVSNTYNFMCWTLFGISLRDTQCGLKLFKKSALDKIMSRLLVKRFAFDIELIVALRENNLRIADAPVAISRQYNQGSVQMGNIWQTFKNTLAVWYRKNRGYYKC